MLQQPLLRAKSTTGMIPRDNVRAHQDAAVNVIDPMSMSSSSLSGSPYHALALSQFYLSCFTTSAVGYRGFLSSDLKRVPLTSARSFAMTVPVVTPSLLLSKRKNFRLTVICATSR